jgi:hypothetical protein
MYYVLMSLASAASLFAGFSHSDGIPFWNFVIAIGGFYLGHVVTEALNHKEV